MWISYLDEDVVFILELALKKTWTSNEKLTIFIADASRHGTKYVGFLILLIQRREINEMIKKG